MLNVMCFGEALIDMLPMDNGYQAMCGGAPANVAVAVSKLGGNSSFVGGLSQDAMGQKIKTELQGFGVNCDFAPEVAEKTALVLVSLDQDGERSFQFYRNNTADQQVTVESLKSLDWQQTDIFHFCSNTFTDEVSAGTTLFALRQIKSAAGIVSFDVNLRLSLWPAGPETGKMIVKQVNLILPYVDLIKLSADELTYLANVQSMSNESFIKETIEQGIKCVVITDGPEVIKWYTKHGNSQIRPPKVVAVDTTAAGDSFIGGLLFKLSQASSNEELITWLNDSDTLIQPMDFASRCGAHTVQKKGAFTALPCLKSLT